VSADANALRWDGKPGHYEVYYVSVTDPASGVGLWIRYTMVAPLAGTGGDATCSLWLMAMDPAGGENGLVGRKHSWPAAEMRASEDPFELRIAGSVMSDRGMTGGFDDVRWDLHWDPTPKPYEHVHPMLQRARIAKTVLVLPHADLEVSGTVSLPGRELAISGARGGQAHLWGSKHANRWAWVHSNDFRSLEGEPREGDFIDGVSVFVSRFGREIGPNTPVVGRFGGRDFASTGPLQVSRNPSHFALTSWQLEARDGSRKVVATVDAPRDSLVGVTYHDPDGDLAYCYNSEIASSRVQVWERDGGDGWRLTDTLVAPGRTHFEYAQREALADLPLLVQ
jgi:hypothetical protein